MPHTFTDHIAGHGPIRPARVVLHTTEGILNAEDLASFFRRLQSPNRADVHYVVDRQGNFGHLVPQDEKAYHVAAYNPSSLGIEQCAFASWNAEEWVVGFDKGLRRVAAALSNIKANHPHIALDRKVNGGVCAHADLGGAGGGHWDPGPSYPWRYVLYMARLHWYSHHEKPNAAARARCAGYRSYVNGVRRKYGVK